MKIRNFLLAATLIFGGTFAVSSCSDDDDDRAKPEFIGPDFAVSKTEVALAGAKPSSITVKAPVRPTVTSDAEWLHVGEITSSLNGNIYNVAIQADENSTFDTRTATLTITAGSEKTTVRVTQYGNETVQIVSVTPSETLDPNGGTVSVKYAATGEVSVDYPAWLVVSRSLSDDVINFTYSANFSDEARTANVVFTLDSDPEITASVSLSQAKTEVSEDMSLNAMQLAAKMYAGVNIGNTLEVPSGETGWGNPVVNKEYIKGLKALGFNSVRIPCAWDSHVSDPATNTIDPAWLDRVNEVVGWIVEEDMYAIVNCHWDNGWLEENVHKPFDEAINKKMHDYWTQIGNKLNRYDQHLLFSGMNEPGIQNGLEGPTVENIIKYAQTFIDAVRDTGGNNALRCLAVSAPNTNIDEAVKPAFRNNFPTDRVEGRLFVEVHYYDPSDFTIMSSDGQWGSKVKLYWGEGNLVPGSDRNCTWGDAAFMNGQFKKMQDSYVLSGIPVILGEYASDANRSKTDFPDMDVDKWKASRADWTKCVTDYAKDNGCVPFYWETGGDISRTNGTAKNAYVITALMEGAAAGIYPF